ncbi:hypothetical protein Taro_002876 [Colocasia esculenta]|uniref:Plant-specific domain TIGR01615 family protein n=1 Tax=Colocasia esculenta TaxID=4460 RepID=A0A843TK48_COLES|nr:hypothetical protein [Colocasia esculenta]
MPAPAFGRAKRVTDPLDDKARARLRGDGEHRPPAGYPSSSGSEHEASDLSGFVRGFFFSDNEGSDDGEADAAYDNEDEHGNGEDGMSDYEVRQPFCAVPAAAMIRNLVNARAASTAEEQFKRDLVAHVSEAVETFAGLRASRSAFLRSVMVSLREMGYRAGMCKSKWERGGGGLAAGNYEYIDVVMGPAVDTMQQRYIVDVQFAGEFYIARPTAEYERVVAELPKVFVGRPEHLQQLLKILALAVRRSLRAREMHIPPWRKGRYMQVKWLGPYRRTLNPVPWGSTSVQSVGPGRSGGVKCPFVGFDTASPVVIPPAARTR